MITFTYYCPYADNVAIQIPIYNVPKEILEKIMDNLKLGKYSSIVDHYYDQTYSYVSTDLHNDFIEIDRHCLKRKSDG